MDYLNNNEIDYLRRYTTESFIRRGVIAKFYSVSNKSKDTYSDYECLYNSPLNIHVVPDEFNELRNFELVSWFPDDAETLPFICSVPFYSDNFESLLITEGSIIEFCYEMGVERIKRFRVSKVMQHGQKRYFMKVNLVPERPKSVEAKEVSSTKRRGKFVKLDGS